MWFILALGAAVLTAFNPILYKRMPNDADTIVVVWGVALLSLLLLAFFTFVPMSRLPTFDWLFALGVMGSAALKLADVSLVTPLLIFSPVFTVLISAIFPGEIRSARGLFGVVCVLVGAH